MNCKDLSWENQWKSFRGRKKKNTEYLKKMGEQFLANRDPDVSFENEIFFQTTEYPTGLRISGEFVSNKGCVSNQG